MLSGRDDEDWFEAYDKVLKEKVDAAVTLKDEVIGYKGKLWVSDSMDVRQMILQEEHYSEVAGQMG
jgi:hypothetical protein